MGIVASFIDRRVGAELNERGVVVWYDPARAWQPWIHTAHGESTPGEEATAAQVNIGGHGAHIVVSTGSHYEVLQACEPVGLEFRIRSLNRGLGHHCVAPEF